MPLSDEGRRIVDEARAAYGPLDEDRARVGASLSLRVTAAAGAAGAASAGSSAAAASAGFFAGKSTVVGLAALVVIGSASVGYWWPRNEARPREPSAASAGSAPKTLEMPEMTHRDQQGSTPSVMDREVEPPARRNRSHSVGAPRITGAKAAPSEPGPDVAGEIALLNEAQKALAGEQPEKALDLLDRHARDFPRGSLTEERSAARIIALCAIGRVTTARAEAAAFVRSSPASPLAERVQAACGAELDPVVPAKGR